MANGVLHSGLQRILELDKEDLGLGSAWPSLPELLKSLLQPVAERGRELLVCAESSQGNQCKAERSGGKSPHMYVRKHRGPDGHQGNTRGVTVGQTLIGAATRSVAPLFASSRKDQRRPSTSSNYLVGP
ncbi:hypothetical protein [Streptomyces luteocolor]|uniref:hypothetical protein n=1 Tax=Streptomyces luteocolor TaxID=285500 RepID=UPI00114D2D7E|nr:hypothetical protein [Streptomyces luteocolor]